MPSWSERTPRERDALVTEYGVNRALAEWLGYSVYHYDKDYRENCYYQLMDGNFNPVKVTPTYRTGQRKTETEAWGDVPDFTAGEALYQVEEGIERHDLTGAYVRAVADLVTGGAATIYHSAIEVDVYGSQDGSRWDAERVAWALLRATPEQRCRAALRAVGVAV